MSTVLILQSFVNEAWNSLRASLACALEMHNDVEFSANALNSVQRLGELLLRVINGVAARFGASERVVGERRRVRKTGLELVALLV
ncbi:50S Ribosomal protein L22p/L17e [Candidatus Hodgkinia cicadicola]|nr:50S Ribosomal protein L22p/L17e [Candidatus Hodgkinia cicadicola]